jgi:hypothetical protein
MTADFPRFLTIEEAAQLLGISVERVSLWIGQCKLPVAARSEYAGFLLRTMTVETIGRELAETLPAEARFKQLAEARRPASTGREARRLVVQRPPAPGDTLREGQVT